MLESRANESSPEYRQNFEHHQNLIADLRGHLERVRQGGPQASVELHRKRGKLTARERIAKLMDPGSEFLELSAMAAFGMYDNEVPAAGVVTGLAVIGGRLCVVVANDATVKGGTYYPETIRKHLRAQEIALENRLPCVYLVDSGGVFLPRQAEVFPDKEHFGRIFYNQAILSSLNIPQISVVLGMCTAGGAYLPAMSDECVIVRGIGTIYLGGPPLVRAATGEVSTAEELGGGEMHSKVSGVTDHLADSDEHALRICRAIVESLNVPRAALPQGGEPPAYSAESLYGILHRDLRRPGDVRDVIARLVDGSRFQEFKKHYGTTLCCGYAKLYGRLIGIVGNSGILFSESAMKGAHFVELCSQRRIPLLFLQNITGFMVGRQAEEGGIVKHGAKMVQAVACAQVPKLTVLIGASHGAGNYGMCGRAYGARFLFSWPNSRISVMGAEQAAGVMVQIKREQLARQKKTLSSPEAEEIAKPILAQYEREGHPYYATARLWDDGIIEPARTRGILGLCLAAADHAPVPGHAFPVFRM
jgi:acetyl-CoA carboxylase carboxyltransferase component